MTRAQYVYQGYFCGCPRPHQSYLFHRLSIRLLSDIHGPDRYHKKHAEEAPRPFTNRAFRNG